MDEVELARMTATQFALDKIEAASSLPSLVSPDDLSQLKRAFDLNGWVGMLYLLTTAAAIYGR